MSEQKHTATPWYGRNTEIISKPMNCCVAIVQYIGHAEKDEIEGLANVDFIVRACNAHDDLVKALQRAVVWCEEHGDTRHQWYADAREAIAKAQV
jgi:hypothetical protein